MSAQRLEVALRWSDVDAYGHVNSVQFLRLLEEARVQAFALTVGTVGSDRVDLVGNGLVVASAEIEYLLPLDFQVRPITVELWVTAVRGADFDLAYRVRVGGSGPVHAQARTTMVAYDLGSGTPRRLTQTDRQLLDGLRDEPLIWRRRHRAAR